MTQAFSSTSSISATADQVWAVLTDWSRGQLWLPGIEAMSGPAVSAVGDRITFTTRGKEQSSTITALDPGKLLTLTSTQGPVTAHYTYTLQSAGDSTQVTLVADVLAGGVMKLLGPTIRSSIAKADSGQLANLKRLVETGA